MDFTALRYFIETANSRSIRTASEKLHVSASAISRQIAKLEHELKAPIFDRRAQGMALTPAGEILRSKVEETIREFDRVRSHIAALQDLQAGTVDIYCFQAAIESFILPVLAPFHSSHPNIVFNVIVSSTDETIEALASGAAEIGLVLNPPAREVISSLEVFRDTIVATMSPDHPLASRKSLMLRDLSEYPLALMVKSFGLRQQVDRIFDRHRFEPQSCCVTNSLAMMKEMARLQNQCALLPRSAVANEVASGLLTTLPVEEFAAETMTFCICVRAGRSLSPPAKAFSDAILDFCRRYM
jgi:DNA-binding transcriptional LysR family regulator